MKSHRNSSSKRRIRYAVVGLGHIAQVAILPAFRNAPNSELAAIVSGDPEKEGKIGKKYRVKHVYSYKDYDRALAEVDAVYLALPNHLHREYAVRAAQAGVHVLCEKPMAVTEAECQEMIDAGQENGVKLMIAYRLHFEAGNLEAVRLAQGGKLGTLRAFTSEFAQQVVDDNVRVEESVAHGGGPLYDMGVYCINAARYLFRAEPAEVTAVTANNGEKRFQNVEEMASVIMQFPEERFATFTCSFGAADISRYTLIGTKGILAVDPAYEYAMGIQHHLITGGKSKTRKFDKRDQFAAELVSFSTTRNPNPPDWKAWQTFASWRRSTGQHEPGEASNSQSCPTRESQRVNRRFIVLPTRSRGPSKPSHRREKRHSYGDHSQAAGK